MATIAFVTADGGGNTPPTLAIARELALRGHRIVILGHPRQEAVYSAPGLEFVGTTDAFAWTSSTARGPVAAALAFARLAGDRGYAREIARLESRLRIDAYVVDAMIPAAIAAARRTGAPTIALMHTVASFFLGPTMRAAAALGGIDAAREYSRVTTMVTADAELDTALTRRRAAGFIWTSVAEEPPDFGPGVKPEPADRGRPHLLVSLSSVHIASQCRLLQRIVDALADVDADVTVTTGPVIDPHDVKAPAGMRIERFVPHRELMPHVTAVVGHGGHSTTMRALMHGLPLVIIPADPRIDQPLVGAAVQRAGAGLALRHGASVRAIAQAATRVIHEPHFAHAAGIVGERLRTAHGIRRAADCVEGVLTASL